MSCDPLTDPLYQHATDFIQHVDLKTLSPVLIKNNLLTSCDMEQLQLPTVIDRDKKDYILAKLICLGKEGYEKFSYTLFRAPLCQATLWTY